MAEKKTKLLTFDETLLRKLSVASDEMGITETELIRNATKLYVALHDKTKEGKFKFYIETEKDKRQSELMILEFL